MSNHQPHDCLLNHLFRCRSKKKHQSSTSLAFVRGIHWWPVNSPHKWPITQQMFPLDDVVMLSKYSNVLLWYASGCYWLIYHVHNSGLQWRHNECDGISNHQPHDCLLKRLFMWRSNKTSKLHITGLCEGNSPVTGEFPAQRASNIENVSIWWRHHGITSLPLWQTRGCQECNEKNCISKQIKWIHWN